MSPGLPDNALDMGSGRRGSNPRPSAWERADGPTSRDHEGEGNAHRMGVPAPSGPVAATPPVPPTGHLVAATSTALSEQHAAWTARWVEHLGGRP